MIGLDSAGNPAAPPTRPFSRELTITGRQLNQPNVRSLRWSQSGAQSKFRSRFRSKFRSRFRRPLWPWVLRNFSANSLIPASSLCREPATSGSIQQSPARSGNPVAGWDGSFSGARFFSRLTGRLAGRLAARSTWRIIRRFACSFISSFIEGCIYGFRSGPASAFGVESRLTPEKHATLFGQRYPNTRRMASGFREKSHGTVPHMGGPRIKGLSKGEKSSDADHFPD